MSIKRLLSFIALAAALHAGSARADLSSTVNFDIAPQTLSAALLKYSEQSRVQVTSPSELVDGQVSGGVSGELSAQDALAQLLKGTQLSYDVVDANTVAIRGVKARDDNETAAGAEAAHSLRLAQGDAAAGSAQSAPTATATDGAKAQSPDVAEDAVLEEITVTAQKRQERLKDVPISISVLGGEDLDRSTAQGITEALNRVPGVATTVTQQTGGSQLAIRGVSAAAALFFGSSPIAYYLDSVPFGLVKTAITPDANAYDLERVEVLRGPQGTLYGASAQNGVVRILTKDANLNAFEFKARTSLSSIEEGGQSYRGDMALNVPLIEGKAGVRAVVGYQRLGGWIDKANDQDANDGELVSARLKFNAQPTEQLSVGLSTWLARDDYGAPPVSASDLTTPSAEDESTSIDYSAHGLKIGYEFPRFAVTSMTSYLDYENAGAVDLRVFDPTNPLAENLFTGIDARVFSEELLFSSKTGNAWRWSLGAFYRDAEDRLRQNNLSGGAPFDFTNVSESYAAFGEIGRRFADAKLEWTLGLRYFRDDNVVTENISLGGPGTDPLPPLDASFNSTTPRAVLTWYPNDGVTVYGSYSEGFRSGFQQDPGVIRSSGLAIPAVKPDKLHNYEIGAKAEVLGRRVSLDAAVYFIKWEDVQLPTAVTIGDPGSTTDVSAPINGDAASGVGIDFAVTMRPADGLELGINAGWNDLTLDEDVILPSGGVVLFNEGERLLLSPEWTIGASADYAFPLGSWTGRFSASANYLSEQTQKTIVPPFVLAATGDTVLLGQTSFSVEAADRWTATLFVDNVTNERSPSLRDPFQVPFWGTYQRPRTIGVQLEVRF